jgi:hypothetical protein
MTAAAALTTKVLAIGSWTAKATPEARPKIMPFEALVNMTDPAEAQALLEKLPLGQAGMCSSNTYRWLMKPPRFWQRPLSRT